MSLFDGDVRHGREKGVFDGIALVNELNHLLSDLEVIGQDLREGGLCNCLPIFILSLETEHLLPQQVVQVRCEKMRVQVVE